MAEQFIHTPRVKLAWLVGVAAAFFIFVVIAAYSSRMTNDFSGYDDQRAQTRYQTLAKVRHDEGALLEPVDKDGKPTATWADQDKGLIKISIEEAMQHAVDDLKNKPAAMGAVIPGTAPASAPAATNAAPSAPTAPASTNAAPGKPAAPEGKPGAKAKASKNTAPSAPDEKKKPASPAASTTAPTPPTQGSH